MKPLNLLIIIATLLFCVSCSCTNSSKEEENLTCRELFEKYKPRDIERFVEVVVSVHKMDSVTAVAYADSLLNYLYTIDSTYVKMDKKDFRKFVDKYRVDAFSHCDSIFGINQ